MWLAQRNGIAHRHHALRAGFSTPTIRQCRLDGTVTVLKRQWLLLDSANEDFVCAATHHGRLACISAAAHRGWWTPPGTTAQRHLWMRPNGHGAQQYARHWNTPITPCGVGDLIESSLDSLRHVAECLPMDDALTVWESAIRQEKLDTASLRIVRWRSARAQHLAQECTGLADSGLETFLVTRLARRGVTVRQQVWLAGRPVDGLIGEWLVVQTDGHEHHSSPSDRARDAAHDAELTLRGYTVLRFTYAQVMRDWPQTERIIMRAIAAGFHLHPRRSFS